MSKLTKRITAMLLAGMLVIGSVPGSVFAADIQEDPGQTSAVAEEVFTEEASEQPADTGEGIENADIVEDGYSEDVSAASTEFYAEEEAQYYTVTLDANGGYFENEWDDAIGDYAQQAEVVEKHIPVDGTVAAFPVSIDPDGQTMLFAGWSLERDGELVSQAGEEYIPVDNCVLYAVWKVTEAEDAGLADTEREIEVVEETESAQEYEDAETRESAQDSEGTEEAEVTNTDQETAEEEYTVSETDNEQETVPDQEVIDSDEEEEVTKEEAVDASVVEFSEEEETAKEDAVNVASGTCGENLTWVLDDAGTLTISGTGEMGSSPWRNNYEEDVIQVIIENGVTSIRVYAFDGFINLTNVTIPDSVTSIGENAFHSCHSLSSITIPDSVTSIGVSAFSFCSSLTSVIIPSNVTSISDYTFSNCSNLMNVTIPEGVKSIGKYAFINCSNITDVSIPDNVTSIGANAFYKCTSLTSMTIPGNVKSIGEYAFFGCTSLTSMTIPGSVKSIGDNAYYGCTSLMSVVIKKGVNSIGGHVFQECSSLIDVIIPEGVTSIGKYAFYGCTCLTSMTIPEGVTSIEEYTFRDCSVLTSVTIPESVTSIKEFAFEGCNSLTSVIIPKSVKSIGDGAFQVCKGLMSVSIQDGVTSIGQTAFYGCSSLTSVKIPNTVTKIGEDAFSFCRNLKRVTVSNTLKNIGSRIFDGCSNLRSVTIPDSVVSIGTSAFNNCTSLIDVYYTGEKKNWESISIASYNDNLLNANIHYEVDTSLSVSRVGELTREVYPEQETTLEVKAASGYQIYYQWYEEDWINEDGSKEFVAIEGEASSTCTVSTTYDKEYYCEISDDGGNEDIINFMVEVVTVDNNLQAYAAGWDEGDTFVSVYVDPYSTTTLGVTASADDKEGIAYKWIGYREDKYDVIDEGNLPECTIGPLSKSGRICCEVRDKYHNVESVYFNIHINNHLVVYPDSENTIQDYSYIYVTPGSDLDLNVVVSADNMEDMTYQWYDDRAKKIEGASCKI